MTKKTNLKKGQVLDSGFIILDVVELDELHAEGIWAKHEKSGVEVFHVLNDDIENLFSFAFTTIPEDNTGAPHILEHSVLCGSERYPLKDAFIVLAQGSLQTFLNAITFPDKTIYPASSTNEHDYFNLMSVYGESVFRPLLPEWTFMQEGHRYEFSDNGRLTITGVVYNEMKGAYSSLDTYAGLWSVKAIMPDTPYSYESGGDPEEIPKLTWENLKEFHRSRYSPANCRVFLAGNISTEKQLSFLNEQFFKGIPAGKACSPIKKTERWNEPKKLNISCPGGMENKPTVFLSWLCSDTADNNETMALFVLAEILLGHDGSPLTRALIESELGEDITPVSGLETEIRESFFAAGLKGVNGNDTEQEAGKIENLIMSELQKLADEGIPPQEIEAALLSIEFSQREIRRSGGPFSLVWMRRSLRLWLHGGKPWEGLLLDPAIKNIKENLASNKKYFESLIKKYLLDNPHRALVILEPEKDFLTKMEEKLSDSLLNLEKKLSNSELLKIKEKSEELEKIQSEEDSPQALASIPHLSRGDLSSEIDIIHRRCEDLNGVPALCHELFTNGISYFNLAFPVDLLCDDDSIWLPFFSRAVTSVGLPGIDYGKVSSLLARTVGGFNAALITTSTFPSSVKTQSTHLDLTGRSWLFFNLKCLDEKIIPSLELALNMICDADFSDQRRINDLVLEMKSEIDSSLAPIGNFYAGGRASRNNSPSRKIEERWKGISQIEFVHRLSRMDTADIMKKLFFLKDKITASGLITNITGCSLDTASCELEKRFKRFGAPLPRPSVPININKNLNEPANNQITEVFASPSLQIGFAAQAFNSASIDTLEQAAEKVLMHQFSTGTLWEDIRMKGGAYGASASSSSLDNCLTFTTYRDPNPQRSIEIFSAILNNNSTASQEKDEDYLVKSIIGCYAKETRPKTSAENGILDFMRYLNNIEDDYRKRELDRLVNISTKDICAAFMSLNSKKLSGTVIITSEKNAGEAAKSLGTDVIKLPV